MCLKEVDISTDSKYLGAKVGYICILHTWGSEMNFHPHIHTILFGGGLTMKNEWKDKGNDFFLPIQVVSMVFRGKYLEELKQLWKDEKLRFYGHSQKYHNHYAFQELLDTCYATEWVPYCKETFNGAQSVIDYLGKYTHRIAISNHRIIHMDEKTVTFFVKDYHNKGHWKEFTLSGVEFIRRFLCMYHQSVTYEFDTMECFALAPRAKNLLFAETFLDAKNIFQCSVKWRCQRLWSNFMESRYAYVSHVVDTSANRKDIYLYVVRRRDFICFLDSDSEV